MARRSRLVDIHELAVAFKQVDRSDPTAVHRWFTEHSELSTNDHALVSGLSTWAIRVLRRFANIGPKHQRRPTKPYKLIRITNITPPTNWRTNKPWLAKMVALHSIRQVALAVGLHRKNLTILLRKLDIPIPTLNKARASRNQCFTHEWCFRHYVLLQYTLEQCAQLAGISWQNFTNWLNRFQIPVRTHYRLAGPWPNILIRRLQEQPNVRSAVTRRSRYSQQRVIEVRFNFPYHERYWVNKFHFVKRRQFNHEINSRNSILVQVPPVYPEYGIDLRGQPLHPAHLAISRADLAKATLIEQRLALANFAGQVYNRGWIPITYPDKVLTDDWQMMDGLDLSRYQKERGFSLQTWQPRPVRFAGRRIMSNYFDWSIFYRNFFRNARKIVYLSTLLLATDYPFNFLHLLRITARRPARAYVPYPLRIPDPNLYTAIFKQLGLQGTMLDLNVGLGAHVLAAAAAGLRYTTVDPAFTYAVERDFPAFAELQYEPYTGQNVDMVFYDEGWAAPDMTKVLPYLGKAKMLIVFVPSRQRAAVAHYRPRSAIKLYRSITGGEPDYLMIW